MKIRVLILYSFLGVVPQLLSQQSDPDTTIKADPVKSRIMAMWSHGRDSHSLKDVAAIAGEYRDPSIALLHKGLEGKEILPSYSFQYNDAMTALLQLGDERAMQLLGELYRKRYDEKHMDIADWAARSRQPAVLTYLALSLFHDESATLSSVQTGDYIYEHKRSVFTGSLIERVIVRSEEISEEVKTWIENTTWAGDAVRAENRDVLRDWWRANESAFREKDYGRVKPGRPLNKIPPLTEAERGSLSLEPSAPRSLNSSTVRLTSASKPAAVISKDVPPETRKSTPAWPWITGAAVLAGLGVLAWKRRSS